MIKDNFNILVIWLKKATFKLRCNQEHSFTCVVRLLCLVQKKLKQLKLLLKRFPYRRFIRKIPLHLINIRFHFSNKRLIDNTMFIMQ